MMWQTRDQDESRLVEEPRNRRQSPRVSGPFSITFSGVDAGRFVIGEGQVLNLSAQGVGSRGNRLLRPGMELALFIELPDHDEHLCVPEGPVSWVDGHHFGVALRTLTREDRNRLRFLLWNQEADIR